jgi:hypothetical protein
MWFYSLMFEWLMMMFAGHYATPDITRTDTAVARA